MHADDLAKWQYDHIFDSENVVGERGTLTFDCSCWNLFPTQSSSIWLGLRVQGN